jgi:hypothetical protein
MDVPQFTGPRDPVVLMKPFRRDARAGVDLSPCASGANGQDNAVVNVSHWPLRFALGRPQ